MTESFSRADVIQEGDNIRCSACHKRIPVSDVRNIRVDVFRGGATKVRMVDAETWEVVHECEGPLTT